MRRVQIEEFLEQSKDALVLDVRSPGEYRHAHMPGAISLPLFSDEERKVVGTTYKQVSRQSAIKVGLDYFGPKMKGMVEEVEKLIADHCPLPEKRTGNEEQSMANIYIYCWRGGMRSGAVAWLLNLYGFNVTVLAGGYKAFRNWVIKTNAYPYRLQLVGGYTGSGKTSLLKELERKGELVVDLEEIASHKGSAFGNIGMPEQPSQEMFENLLSLKLQAVNSRQVDRDLGTEAAGIWIEDESQRIGHVNIPKPFWDNMRRSPVYFLDIPFEERLDNLVQEYGVLDKVKMADAIQRIAKRLGPLESKTAIQFLYLGHTKECFRILLHYYDKHYLKGLHNRQDLATILTTIPCEKVSVDNAALVSKAQVGSTYAGKD
jgi:tRNA 2-selenouridine synthase